MALVVKDRVKETTSTTGTGTLTLGGAVTGFQTFTSVLSNSDTTYYAIFESSTGQFEVGLGTFTSSGTTLARTTILESSNSGNAINLTAGAADVFITQPAEKAVYLDASGHIAAADGRNVTNVAASTAATLATARNIGGVSFDGSANIDLAGVNTAGNQNTSGNAATATILATSRNIGGVAFNGSASINLPGVNTSGNQDTSGNAATATALETGRTISLTGDVTGTSGSFDGSGNASIAATIAANSVALGTDTTGNYVSSASGGTGVTVSGGTGEGSTPSISIGQAVGTGNSPTFAGMTLNGTLTLGANVINDVEDIYLRDKLFHDGDTDTYLGFASNQINLVTGGTTEMFINGSGVFLGNSALHEDYDALSGTSPSVDVNNGGAFSLTMSGNTTFTFGGTTSGYGVGFVLQVTGNGSTLTWPSSVDWAGGTAPDAPASGASNLYVFYTRDGGTNWIGVLSAAAYA